MTDAPKKARTSVLPSDIDAQGNITIWDHGPLPPKDDVAKDSDEYKRLEAEAKEWHRVNGDGPVPVLMEAGSAGHAVTVEPDRWSFEPEVDDAAVAAKVKEIQDNRAKAQKAKDDAAAAAQLAADRKVAIGLVMAERKAKLEADALAAKAPKPKPRVETGAEMAARLAKPKTEPVKEQIK